MDRFDQAVDRLDQLDQIRVPGPGWGILYQGGGIGPRVAALPGPLVIVSMDRGSQDLLLIDRSRIRGVLAFAIEDTPEAILPDAVFLAGIRAGLAFWHGGINLYVHCAAGISRSSYYVLGLLVATLKTRSTDQCLDLLRTFRPQANPNRGFVAQLRALEPALREIC